MSAAITCGVANNFNPHSPCGERLIAWHRIKMHLVISIHTPLAGSDILNIDNIFISINFNPHSPCGERRYTLPPTYYACHYFNPHSPCGERPTSVYTLDLCTGISIHTPLAGSDTRPWTSCTSPTYFNPHSPCGERPVSIGGDVKNKNTFQSTLPLRGATHAVRVGAEQQGISIHTPLAGSDRCTTCGRWLRGLPISIHTPLAGSDDSWNS